MSDDRTATLPAAPVHFEHWCDQPGCRSGDRSARSAAGWPPSGAAASIWPPTTGMAALG